MHGLAAARTSRAFRFDDLLDARQMCWQRTPVGAALLRPLALEVPVLLLLFRFRLGAGDLQFLKHKIELVFTQPFRFAAEPRPPQHRDNVMELVIGGAELIALCHSRVALRNEQPFVRPLCKKNGPQSVKIIGKRIGRSGDHGGQFR